MTTGSIGDVQNSQFTTALSVRQAQSDERVIKATGAIPAPKQKNNIFLFFSRKLRERVLVKNSCKIDQHDETIADYHDETIADYHDETIADHQPLTTANDEKIADHQPLTTANDGENS